MSSSKLSNKRKFIGIVLALVLVLTMAPTMAFADDGDSASASIYLSTGGIGDGDFIYYGNDYYFSGSTSESGTVSSNPTKWRVLDANKTNTDAEGMFLLSENSMGADRYGDVYFNNPASNVYQGSFAQNWCSNYLNHALSSQEQSAIKATTKSDKEYTSTSGTSGVLFAASDNILNGDKVFFLSAEEAEAYLDDSTRAVTCNYNGGTTTTYANWWLRSKYGGVGGSASSSDVGLVLRALKSSDWTAYGYVTSAVASSRNKATARPAFNLDKSAVLFSSPAAGGKGSGEVGTLTANTASEDTSEWKLTVLDSSRSDFKASLASGSSDSAAIDYENWSVDVNYSGAAAGDNEYVSAMLLDSENNVLYYGNLANNSAEGTAKVDIPAGLEKGNYTLRVFSEQFNGDNKTDYASTVTDIKLSVALPKAEMPNASFTAADDNSGTLTNVTAGMKYSLDGGETWNDVTDTTMTVSGVSPEKGIQVYQQGDNTTNIDSEIQIIAVTQASAPESVSAVNCLTSANNDGAITGVAPTMEYQKEGNTEWTAIDGTSITGLTDGIYYIRVKANGAVLASETVTVTIEKYVASAPGDTDQPGDGDTDQPGDADDPGTGSIDVYEDVTDNDTDSQENITVEEQPQTGDNSNLVPWFVLLLMGGLGAVGIVVYDRKKQYSER